MKHIKIILVVFLLSLTGFAFAQGGAGQQPPGGAPAQGQAPAGGGAMQQQSVEDEVKSLAAQLGLTTDQSTKVLAILKEREQGVLKVRSDFPVAKPGSNPSKEGIAAMDKVMGSARTKIMAVLNDEQKKKYEATQSTQEMGGSQGGPQGAPQGGQKK